MLSQGSSVEPSRQFRRHLHVASCCDHLEKRSDADFDYVCDENNDDDHTENDDDDDDDHGDDDHDDDDDDDKGDVYSNTDYVDDDGDYEGNHNRDPLISIRKV